MKTLHLLVNEDYRQCVALIKPLFGRGCQRLIMEGSWTDETMETAQPCDTAGYGVR